MRNRVLEIVVMLMDSVQENDTWISDIDDMSSTLRSMGYTDQEISSAFGWLAERFHHAGDRFFVNFSRVQSTNRILSQHERLRWTPDAYGFLLKLFNYGLITNEQAEMIIEQALVYTPREVNVERVKRIAAALMFADLDMLDDLDADQPYERHDIN
jgi:uncharacterized protein Smg (DUF494 family)